MAEAPGPGSWWRRVLVAMWDALPPAPEERDEAERREARDPDAVTRRKIRFRVSLFEKKGRGGLR